MKINYNGVEYDASEKWSYGIFTNRMLSSETDLSGSMIYASCFYHESPGAAPFPSGMVGVTFIKCDLSNLEIPPGNTVIDCAQRRFFVQNDLRDWELDVRGRPVRLVDEQAWSRIGKSIDPADIPAERVSDIDQVKEAR